MKSINFEIVGAVAHHTFSERKINDNTPLKTAGALWLFMKNKMEI